MHELNGPDAAGAAAALGHTEQLRGSVDRRSRWLVRYQLGYGAASLLMVAALGLLHGPAGVVISGTCWVLVIAALSVYAVRQPVAHRGMALTHGVMIGTWGVLYAAVLIPGLTVFRDEPAWWLPGAVAVSLPGFVCALWTARRTGR